jgi:glutathionyl-hydroquinone reductase
VRFDSVYHGHFKCNVRRIVDYEALINPSVIVPIGPALDFTAPHGRG